MAKYKEPNDALQQLKQSLKEKAPDRLYVFHGEETFLLHHYLEQLKKLLVDPLTESFNYHRLGSETFDLQTFADSVENLPMMAEYTFVWVDDVDLFSLGESERNRLTEVLSDIPEYCTIVFSFVTVEWKPDKRMKKLYDALHAGRIVEFEKQSQRDLITWITRHFRARGKSISSDLCAYLIELTGGTMTALSGEIAKICAYSGADTIVKADIDAVTEPVLDAVAFQMTDLLSRGEHGAALVKLRQLLQMQQEPISVLGAVGSHFRKLSTAKTLLESGKGPAELMRLCGMGDFPARKTMSMAGKFSNRFYRCAAELVLETDYKMKTSFDSKERLLELLVLRLAQEARNG